MSLTFEMANLDFAPLYGASFAKNGDEASSALMKTILEDEIGHVSFGCRWLQKWKENSSEWDLWVENLPQRILPGRAKGPFFFEEHRKSAGIPEEWIFNLKDA